jgi:hypothetical protein
LSATVAGGVSLVSASSAQASYPGYYWGCTYSWPTVCKEKYQYLEDILTMDQDHAAAYVERAPENGYPKPSKGHPEHTVCGGVWAPAENRQIIGWACGYGSSFTSFGGLYGQPMIGGGEQYSVSMYQLENES